MKRVVVLLAAVAGFTWAAEPPGLREVVEEALAAGRADQVLRLLPSGTDLSPELRLLGAQAQAQVAGPAAALDRLAVPQSDSQAGLRWLEDWPVQQRGQLAAQVGDWAHAAAQGDALWWWTQAIDRAGPGVDVDRLLLAVAEGAAAAQRWQLVESSAGTLWQRRLPWQQRERAGELLGIALLQREPEQGLRHLLALLANPRLADDAHQRIALSLARSRWRSDPATIVQVAQRARGGEGDGSHELDMWRALALGMLDPEAGLQAIAALAEEWQQQSLVQRQRQDLVRAQGRDASPQERQAQAEAAILIGDYARATELLQPFVRHDSGALRLWLRIPESSLEGLLRAPSAGDPRAGLALVKTLAWRAQRPAAWGHVQRLLAQETDLPSVLQADLLLWAVALAQDQAPTQRPRLQAAARALAIEHPAVGQAWAEWAVAQRDRGEQAAAWVAALRYLPADAPWAPIAARQVLHGALAEVVPWTVVTADPPLAADLLDRAWRAALAGDADDHHAASWLVAQALVAHGRIDEAHSLLSDLQERVPAARRPRIERAIAALSSPPE